MKLLLVKCSACGLTNAPEPIGVCERCRRRNSWDLRAFHEAAMVIGRLDLDTIGGLIVYPFRVPLEGVDAARLARAARPLQVAVRELQQPRKPAKSVETPTQEGVKQWKARKR